MRHAKSILLGAILLLVLTPFSLAVTAQSQPSGTKPIDSSADPLSAPEQRSPTAAATASPEGNAAPRSATPTNSPTSTVTPTSTPTATSEPCEPVAWADTVNV